MRHIALVVAILAGAVLVGIAAQYGSTLTDNPKSALAWGFLYGFVTLGGLFGHGLALRVWRHDKKAGLFIGAVAMAAFIIGLSNSLGSMASRGNETTAKRQSVAGDVEDLRGQLKIAEEERKGLKYDPADEDTVNVANEAATNASTAKLRACKYRRGQACIEKENAEKTALEKKTKATNDKAAADRAKKLDEEIIPGLREQIRKAGPVLETNSQGLVLARLAGYTEEEAKKEAPKLLARQNLGMVTVVDMLIVAAMIGYEALTHAHHAAQERPPVPQVPVVAKGVSVRVRELEEMEPDELPPLLATPKPRLISSQVVPFGNVFAIAADVSESGPGKLELREFYIAYARACKEQGKRPVGVEKFAEDIKKLCEASGVKIQVEGDKVYLLNVRLKASEERELEGEAS
jgi:hypothetical protein